MKATKTLRKSEIFPGDGPLAQAADRATAAGFRYFSLAGRIFELESGRAEGSSLGLHSIKTVTLTE